MSQKDLGKGEYFSERRRSPAVTHLALEVSDDWKVSPSQKGGDRSFGGLTVFFVGGSGFWACAGFG